MKWKTHIAGGLVLGLAAYKTLGLLDIHMVSNATELFICGYGCMAGSIAPDMDIMMYMNTETGDDKAIKSISGGMFGHRGITHSLFFLIMMTATFSIFYGFNPFVIGVGIGYLSHLILDSLTPTGVPFFFPYMKKYHFTRIKTGSQVEEGFMGILVAIMACLVFL